MNKNKNKKKNNNGDSSTHIRRKNSDRTVPLSVHKRRKAQVNYKKALETAAKGMIEILEPDILIKLIVRLLVTKIKVKHAGVILYEEEKKAYVLAVSRGERGLKVPVGFTRLNVDSPSIQFFCQRRNYLINESGAVSRMNVTSALKKRSLLNKYPGLKELLVEVNRQMKIYNAEVYVPSYFQKQNLLGILILGKKRSGKRFSQDELNFFMALADDAAMAIRNAQLYNRLRKTLMSIVKAFALDVEKFDPYFTRQHMERMFKYSAKLVEKLKAKSIYLGDLPTDLLIAAIFLHDVGKRYIPKEILYKEGKLTDEEFEIIKRHPSEGAEIFEQIDGLHEVARIIRHHQEKYNGRGYPDGLKGNQIPVGAKIAAVLDAFDAMTNSRPYRKSPMPIEEAVRELLVNKGTQFDPQVVDTFMVVLKEEYRHLADQIERVEHTINSYK